ncbi:MAG: hypothetical protein WCD00_14995 [Desulfuromonadaceae bacterium]
MKKVGVNGGTVTILTTPVDIIGNPTDLTADSTDIYWTEGNSSTGANPTIKKMNINGGPITTIAIAQQPPGAIAIDATNVFWIEQGDRFYPPPEVYSRRRPCLRLVLASKVSTTGVVMSTYVPAGDIPLGSLSQTEPSAKELTRRAKMATDAT